MRIPPRVYDHLSRRVGKGEIPMDFLRLLHATPEEEDLRAQAKAEAELKAQLAQESKSTKK